MGLFEYQRIGRLICLGNPAASYTNPSFELDQSSPQITDIARRRLRTCKTSHPQCREDGLRALPTRVIEVSDVALKLTSTRKGAEYSKGEYVALSYCWGGNQTFVTTLATLKEKEAGFPQSVLPQTLKDAISVTRSLGFRYIWIDALCIIQDSDEDKAAEISVMGDVYKNSSLTIVATNASGVDKGFLLSRKTETPSVNIPILLPKGDFGTLSIVPIESDRMPKPLDTRGWAFQEFMLSRRLLIFELDTFFQCRTKTSREDSCLIPSNIPHSSEFLPSAALMMNRASFPAAMFSKSEHLPAPDFPKLLWWRIAVSYSDRQVTNLNDRFVAVVAIARELNRIYNVDYFAGLWETTMIEDLAWKRERQSWGDRGQRGAAESEQSYPTFGAPSWSWISFGSKISYPYYEKETFTSLFAKFVRCEVASDDGGRDPFGRIIRGKLVLNATLMPVQDLSFHRKFGGYCKHLSLDESNLFYTLVRISDCS
jgi:hypothetical protein